MWPELRMILRAVEAEEADGILASWKEHAFDLFKVFFIRPSFISF